MHTLLTHEKHTHSCLRSWGPPAPTKQTCMSRSGKRSWLLLSLALTASLERWAGWHWWMARLS